MFFDDVYQPTPDFIENISDQQEARCDMALEALVGTAVPNGDQLGDKKNTFDLSSGETAFKALMTNESSAALTNTTIYEALRILHSLRAEAKLEKKGYEQRKVAQW